jgi:hypothetical protein
LLADYVLFIVPWGAIGMAALVSGVVAVWSVSRRMNRAVSPSSGHVGDDSADELFRLGKTGPRGRCAASARCSRPMGRDEALVV